MGDLIHSRTSRLRRAIALMAWGCLIFTAAFLWNQRQSGELSQAAYEPVVFVLTAFAAFVGVFAWMLFNPSQSRKADSLWLTVAAGGTLFPPPIIGYCLMPVESPFKWWLAIGFFMLIVVALLSHVPDEFFGIPRGRSSYIMPLPVFDSVVDDVMDPQAQWFTFQDLSNVVSDVERPSLAPRAYLNDNDRPTSTPPRRLSDPVDDLPGTDYELGLLDDSLLDYELDRDSFDTGKQGFIGPEYIPEKLRPTPDRPRNTPPAERRPSRSVDRSTRRPSRSERPTNQQPHTASRTTRSRTVETPDVYSFVNETSRRLEHEQKPRPTFHAPASRLDRKTKRDRLAESIRTTSTQAATLAGAYAEAATPQLRQNQFTNRRSTPPPAPAPAPPTPPAREIPAETQHSGYSDVLSDVASRLDDKTNKKTTRPAKSSPASTASAAAAGLAAGAIAKEGLGRSVLKNLTPKVPIQDEAAEQAAAFFQDSAETVQEAVRPPKNESRKKPRRSRYDDSRETPRPPVRSDVYDRSQPEPTAPVEEPTIQRRAERTQKPAEKQTREQRSTTTAPTKSQTDNREFERTKEANGSELIEGVMNLHFDKGQKRANLHVPFSPPMQGAPEVECESMDGAEIRLKVPVRQPYGIRIEARRVDDSKPLDTEIGFAAFYTAD